MGMHGARPETVLNRVGAETTGQASARGLTTPHEEPHPSPKTAGQERRATSGGESLSEERGPKNAVISASEILGPPLRKAAPERSTNEFAMVVGLTIVQGS